MKGIRRILMSLLFVFCAQALPASATLISAGTYIFNLDFTADIPYAEGGVSFSASPLVLGAGQVMLIFLFSDFNAGGVLGGVVTAAGPLSIPSVTATAFSSQPGFLDGLFSVRLTLLNTGSVNIDSLIASVLDADGGVIASQTLIPSAAPEPATLALLGLCLAGLGLFSRRSCGF